MQRIATASRRLRATRRNLAAHTAGSNDSGRTVPSQVPTLKRQRNTRQRRYGRALVAEALREHAQLQAEARQHERRQDFHSEFIGPDAVLIDDPPYDGRSERVVGVLVGGEYFEPEELREEYLYTTVEGVDSQWPRHVRRVQLFAGSEHVATRETHTRMSKGDPSYRDWYPSVLVKPTDGFNGCGAWDERMADHWIWLRHSRSPQHSF